MDVLKDGEASPLDAKSLQEAVEQAESGRNEGVDRLLDGIEALEDPNSTHWAVGFVLTGLFAVDCEGAWGQRLLRYSHYSIDGNAYLFGFAIRALAVLGARNDKARDAVINCAKNLLERSDDLPDCVLETVADAVCMLLSSGDDALAVVVSLASSSVPSVAVRANNALAIARLALALEKSDMRELNWIDGHLLAAETIGGKEPTVAVLRSLIRILQNAWEYSSGALEIVRGEKKVMQNAIDQLKIRIEGREVFGSALHTSNSLLSLGVGLCVIIEQEDAHAQWIRQDEVIAALLSAYLLMIESPVDQRFQEFPRTTLLRRIGKALAGRMRSAVIRSIGTKFLTSNDFQRSELCDELCREVESQEDALLGASNNVDVDSVRLLGVVNAVNVAPAALSDALTLASLGEQAPLSRIGSKISGDRMMENPTVLIVTTMSEEFNAMRAMFRAGSEKPAGPHDAWCTGIMLGKGGDHVVLLAQTALYGNNWSAMLTQLAATIHATIDRVIVCGIGGGAPNPALGAKMVRLGDVVVGTSGVIQYDYGKLITEGFDVRAPLLRPNAVLLGIAQMLERDSHPPTRRRPWQRWIDTGLSTLDLTLPDLDSDFLLDADGGRVEPPTRADRQISVHCGKIASGNAIMANCVVRDRVRDQLNVLAFEMEGAGAADAAWSSELKGYLVVRGICDYSDDRSKKAQTDYWKAYAALTAAAYVRCLIQEMQP